MKRLERRISTCLRRFSLLAGLTITLATPVAAEPVYLLCSGTIDSTEPIARAGDGTETVAVTLDLSRKTISFGGHPAWPLEQNNSQNLVNFQGNWIDESGAQSGTKGTRLYIVGDINRITGEAIVHLHRGRADGPQISLMLLTCKPARPLF